MLYFLAPEIKVHVYGVFDGADGPAGSLFEMGGEIVGNGAELEGFVDVGCCPAFADEEVGCCDVFGDAADGDSSYVVQSSAAADVAGSGTPGGTKGVLDRFSDVNEEIEGLADGI